MIRSFLLVGAMLVGATASASAQDFHRVTVMAFNAENLFDTEDDPANTGDDTYLPLVVKQSDPDHEANCRANNSSAFYIRQCIELDWSEAVLETKLGALADVLIAASPRPDIVIMPETENLAVIELLNTTLPESERYETLIQLDTTSVTEDRGIDVAILSRLALAAPAAAHRINFGSDARLCGGTRDIVEAPLSLPDGKVLHVFGVHFPSGGNPLICRQRAMAELNRIRSLLPADALVIAGGDFNFNCSETQGALFERMVRHGKWGVPPAVRAGCDEPGTNKHADRSFGTWFTWSYLDFFLVSENMLAERSSTSGWFANLGSFRTFVGTAQQIETNAQGYVFPRRFDPEVGVGVSDHWPVMIDLVSRPGS